MHSTDKHGPQLNIQVLFYAIEVGGACKQLPYDTPASRFYIDLATDAQQQLLDHFNVKYGEVKLRK